MCGYIYDESLGDPEEGIAPGTAWEDIPEDWYCPDCGPLKRTLRWWKFNHDKSKLKFKWVDVSARVK